MLHCCIRSRYLSFKQAGHDVKDVDKLIFFLEMFHEICTGLEQKQKVEGSGGLRPALQIGTSQQDANWLNPLMHQDSNEASNRAQNGMYEVMRSLASWESKIMLDEDKK